MKVEWKSDRLWSTSACGAQSHNVYSLNGYCFAKTEAEAIQKQSAMFFEKYGFTGSVVAIEIPIGEITERMKKASE